MAQQLFNRSVLLAKLEGTFRTDPLPLQDLNTTGVIDATADVDNDPDEIDEVAHGWTTGTGPVQAVIVTGALPTGLTVLTDYWVIEGVDADSFSLALSRADAIAGTVIALTAAVGTFTVAQTQADARLVIEPDFAPDTTVLDREVARPHLSQLPGAVGRKLGVTSFQHECKNNGVTDATLAPALGVLLRGCGMAQTTYGETGNETETIVDDITIPLNDATGAFTFAKTTAFVGTLPRVVVLQCTTPGGSGVADFTVFSPAVGSLQAEVNSTGNVMTDSVAFDLAESAQITPTITTSFATGDTFVINLAPAGHYYTPVSQNFESLTLYVFFEDLLHIQTGSRGTFTAEGEAGQFATFTFTFTGDFSVAVDSTFPTAPVFEQTVPRQVELANLTAVGGKDFVATDPDEFDLCAQSFSIDIGNDVQPRECINGANSLEGAVITARSGTFAFNPETELEADNPFWSILDDGDRIFWSVRVGRVQGNVVKFDAPFAQYTNIAYGNRNNIRIYDVTGRLAAATDAGNDELRIIFC